MDEESARQMDQERLQRMQQEMERQTEMMALMSNRMKAAHDAMMAIINNMR